MTMYRELWEVVALTVITLSFSIYALTAVGGVLACWLTKPLRPSSKPGVSILKPLAGTDDELRENLDSFARLEYPNYELLIGVASDSDPAYEVAKRFASAHPSMRCRVLLTGNCRMGNPKIAQLVELERAARFDVLIISDSNVRAHSDYLSALVAELSKPGVAMTSSPVVGTGERTFGAAMENIQLAGHIAPIVLTSWKWAGHPISIGKSIAIRRDALREVGGFASLGDILAEDYVLGRAVATAGFGVTVCPRPVENRNIDCSFRRTIERHTRWAKLRRSITPVAFALEPLLCPVVVATLACLLTPTNRVFSAFLCVAVLQTMAALLSVRLLRGVPLAWRWVPMEFALSFIGLYCWLTAWFSRRVQWRGHAFVLSADSRIKPVPARAASRVWARLPFRRSVRIDEPASA